MDIIDLTPEGVKKDSARVNRAIEALDRANADCAAVLEEMVQDRANALVPDWSAAREVLAAQPAAQEEFLRAVCGRPPVGAS